MVERICPQCQNTNPLENRFCGSCGAALDRQQLAPSQPAALVLSNANLPAQVRQIGGAVALSLAALAAEAGMAWLRRKVDQLHTTPPTLTVQQPAATPVTRPAPQPQQHQIVPQSQANNTVTIISQRIVEVWEQGVMTRQTVERSFWRREE